MLLCWEIYFLRGSIFVKKLGYVAIPDFQKSYIGKKIYSKLLLYRGKNVMLFG